MRAVEYRCSLAVAALVLVVAPYTRGADTPLAIRAEVLAAVEGELVHLSKQADKETKPEHPRPSSEVAFLLLTGLSSHGSEIKRPTADEVEQLGANLSDGARVQVFTITDDARVMVSTATIRDKAGSWTSKRAVLYRLKDGKWVERGSGSTALNGVEQSK